MDSCSSTRLRLDAGSPCKNCGGVNTKWAPSVGGDSSQSGYCRHPVLLVLGCGDCSETLSVVDDSSSDYAVLIGRMNA